MLGEGAENIKQRKTPMRAPVWILFVTLLAAPAIAADEPETSAHEFTECPDCPPMVGIPAGKFLMGSPKAEPGRFDSEGPQACA